MVGFTTTIPVEILFAAGEKPCDLNNIFISDGNSIKLVEDAEKIGFPRNSCSWIKGMFSAVVKKKIDVVITVNEGDCSNAKALMEVMELYGIKCFNFSYNRNRDINSLKKEIERMVDFWGINIEKAINEKNKIDKVRQNLKYLDELTWKYGKATGMENHFWLVSSTDFEGDYNLFNDKLIVKIGEIEARKEENITIKLGYIGVPPIFSSFYEYIESLGARVIFNEVQKQFSMVDSIGNSDIIKTYTDFTYPYDLAGRIDDINKNIRLRNLNGIIHYTQSFCHRGIEDIVIRKKIDVPVLTIDADKPGELDSRTKLRIEAFVDMLKDTI